MLRAILVGFLALFIAATSGTNALAQTCGQVDEAVGYVDLVQTTVFTQGDTLTGASRATAHPPENVTIEMNYYIRARLIDYTATPVTDWVYDAQYLLGGQSAQLAPVASQYTVPCGGGASTAYVYEVQLRVIGPDVPGQGPPPHWDIDYQNVYFTN